jgi:hypothetical protein
MPFESPSQGLSNGTLFTSVAFIEPELCRSDVWAGASTPPLSPNVQVNGSSTTTGPEANSTANESPLDGLSRAVSNSFVPPPPAEIWGSKILSGHFNTAALWEKVILTWRSRRGRISRPLVDVGWLFRYVLGPELACVVQAMRGGSGGSVKVGCGWDDENFSKCFWGH